MTPPPPLPPDGAPPSAKQRAAQARCAAMVAHTRALISERGIARFSVNEVLRLSGGSKATLVKYFGDRSGLLAAATAEEVRDVLSALELDHGTLAAAPLREALRVTLTGVLRFYLAPGSLAIYRTVVAMGAQDRPLAAALYDHGHRHVVEAIREILHAKAISAANDGQRLDDAADQLVHAIRAGPYERALIGLDPVPVNEPDIARRIDRTLDLLLPGIEAALRD